MCFILCESARSCEAPRSRALTRHDHSASCDCVARYSLNGAPDSLPSQAERLHASCCGSEHLRLAVRYVARAMRWRQEDREVAQHSLKMGVTVPQCSEHSRLTPGIGLVTVTWCLPDAGLQRVVDPF